MEYLLNVMRVRKDKNVVSELRELEDKLEIKVPPIYRLFYETFPLGEDYRNYEYYYSNKHDTLLFLGQSFKFPDFPMLTYIDEFLDADSILLALENSLDYEFSIVEAGYMPIALCENRFLFVGIHSSNIDQIYFESFQLNEKESFEKISGNIISLVSSIEIGEVENIVLEVKYSNLFKNWGEDFWRVRNGD